MYRREETTLSAVRIEKVRQAKKQIDAHIAALAEEMRQGKSEQMKRFLNYVAQFHQYSLGNLILAMIQRPEMTRIAGLRQWNKLGRTVKPGEKGIMILAPVTILKKDLETEEEMPDDNGTNGEHHAQSKGGQVRGGSAKDKHQGNGKQPETVLYFKPVYVFDIAQTQGAEPPSMIHANGLERRVFQFAGHDISSSRPDDSRAHSKSGPAKTGREEVGVKTACLVSACASD